MACSSVVLCQKRGSATWNNNVLLTTAGVLRAPFVEQCDHLVEKGGQSIDQSCSICWLFCTVKVTAYRVFLLASTWIPPPIGTSVWLEILFEGLLFVWHFVCSNFKLKRYWSDSARIFETSSPQLWCLWLQFVPLFSYFWHIAQVSDVVHISMKLVLKWLLQLIG